MSKFLAASAGLALAAGALAGSTYGPGPGVGFADLTTVTSDIVVGDSFTVATASVDIDFSHTWVGDLTMVLSNGSSSLTLFARPGNPGSTFGFNVDMDGVYSFADGGADFEAATAGALGSLPAGGTYAAEGGTFAAAFGGGSSAGTWTLSITDDAGGDTGALRGWTLNLAPVPTPGAAALMGLAGIAGLRRRR